MIRVLPPALRALHQRLGIPANYSARLRLQPVSEAPEAQLATIATDPKEIRLLAPAAAAWTNLRDAAAAEKIVLWPISGFRSIAYQAELIRRKLEHGLPLDAILAVNLAPGFSEHHSGCAIDLTTPGDPPLEESFGETTAFHWLQRRASEFSFSLSYPHGNPHALRYEPWHWLWRNPVRPPE